MLVGVYQGLFAAAAELGIADMTKAEALRPIWLRPPPTAATTA
jgi:hypothetical protein